MAWPQLQGSGWGRVVRARCSAWVSLSAVGFMAPPPSPSPPGPAGKSITCGREWELLGMGRGGPSRLSHGAQPLQRFGHLAQAPDVEQVRHDRRCHVLLLQGNKDRSEPPTPMAMKGMNGTGSQQNFHPNPPHIQGTDSRTQPSETKSCLLSSDLQPHSHHCGMNSCPLPLSPPVRAILPPNPARD